MITSSDAGRILEVLDALATTSGLSVRVGGSYEDIADTARDAARLIREAQEHGDPELREALAELRELRAELAERQGAEARWRAVSAESRALVTHALDLYLAKRIEADDVPTGPVTAAFGAAIAMLAKWGPPLNVLDGTVLLST